MTSAYLLAVLVLGYALGRVRPWHSLEDAAWWRGISQLPKPSAHPTAWAVTWLAMNPTKWWETWQNVRRMRRAQNEPSREVGR